MTDPVTTYAQIQPDKPAVIEDGPGGVLRWTYAELEAQANRVANALIALGAGPGRKVMWCGANSAQVVAVITACRKIGAIAVPLNYRLSRAEALYVIGHCDAEIACVDAEFAAIFAPAADRPASLRQVIVFGGSPPAGLLGEDFLTSASAQPPALGPGATSATMTYTSGTTGRPKGAVRYAITDSAPMVALSAMIGYTPDDVYLTSGPLYHGGPSGFMAIGLGFGQTIVLQRKFDPEDWLRLVHEYRVTSTFAAPAPVRMVCALPDEVKAHYDTSSMRRMIGNAAPWSFALKQRYLADFPPDSLWEIYASTELGINCVLEPKDQLRKPGSCGKPAPGVEVVLLDGDGGEVTGTGPGHAGELYVRGSVVFDAYYKQEDAYDAARRGDFHTVGDIAYRDDEGYLYICDRKNDMIISGGMNIYPAEIEAALELHPDIYDVAVFGIPSEDWGEAVHAAVVLAPGSSVSAEDVTAFAREHLAGYKAPRSISFVDELPRTGSGKILKRQLRAPYWAGRAAQVG
jgi:acyl-CoA synthetase (AMP-forming)/AMP-acid ligase II